jgi:hypothetical protein
MDTRDLWLSEIFPKLQLPLGSVNTQQRLGKAKEHHKAKDKLKVF